MLNGLSKKFHDVYNGDKVNIFAEGIPSLRNLIATPGKKLPVASNQFVLVSSGYGPVEILKMA